MILGRIYECKSFPNSTKLESVVHFIHSLVESIKNPRYLHDVGTTKVKGPDTRLINCEHLICFVSPVSSMKTQKMNEEMDGYMNERINE